MITGTCNARAAHIDEAITARSVSADKACCTSATTRSLTLGFRTLMMAVLKMNPRVSESHTNCRDANDWLRLSAGIAVE